MTEPHASSRRRAALRPLELVGGSLILSGFVAGIFLLVTHNLTVFLVMLGAVFIVAMLGLSMFALAIRPEAADDSAAEESPQV